MVSWATRMFWLKYLQIDSYHLDLNQQPAPSSKPPHKTRMTSLLKNYTRIVRPGQTKNRYPHNQQMEMSSKVTWIYSGNPWMWTQCFLRCLHPQLRLESLLPMRVKVQYHNWTKLMQLGSRHAVETMEMRQMLAPNIRYAATICYSKSLSSLIITRVENSTQAMSSLQST